MLEILCGFIARETVILNIYRSKHNNYLRNIAFKASLDSLSNLPIQVNRSALKCPCDQKNHFLFS